MKEIKSFDERLIEYLEQIRIVEEAEEIVEEAEE